MPIAIVTGSSTGIGFATSLTLVRCYTIVTGLYCFMFRYNDLRVRVKMVYGQNGDNNCIQFLAVQSVDKTVTILRKEKENDSHRHNIISTL